MLSISLICGLVVIVCGVVMFVSANEASATKALVKRNGEQPTPEQVESSVKTLKKSARTFIIIGVVLALFGLSDILF